MIHQDTKLLKDILQPDAEVDERFVVNKTLTLLDKLKDHEFKQIGYFGEKNECGVGGQALRVYTTEGKSTTSGVGLYKIGHIGDDDAQANRVYSTEGKSVTLSANGGGLGAKTGLYDVGRIRKLTPIECERLQGLPDNYTQGIAMTHRYKCIGNAFNVDVIAHILSFMK
jgi:site-specific DNA-cytosine methylase